jgi:hypothetical protein
MAATAERTRARVNMLHRWTLARTKEFQEQRRNAKNTTHRKKRERGENGFRINRIICGKKM